MSKFKDSLLLFLNKHYTEQIIISGNEPYELNYLFDPQTRKGAFQFISKSENSEEMEYTEGIPDENLFEYFLKECQLKISNFNIFEHQSIMYDVFDSIKEEIIILISHQGYTRNFELNIGIVIME